MTLAQRAIHTDGTVSCGTLLWRFHGQLQLTVVVKAVFTIVPDGVATPAGPGQIIAEDQHLDGSPSRSVVVANDLAPYLPRCDVLFTGHAHALGEPITEGAVRLGVSRGERWLLDKMLYVYGDRGPTGAPEPFTRMPIVYERAGEDAPNLADPSGAPWPAGFGPISRHWPSRRLVLGRIDPGGFDRPIPELPEEMPWEYFQAAPLDQQIDLLRGGEWLMLEGLDPTRPRVHTCLPPARAAARVVTLSSGAGPMESDVDLVCDTLAIDGDGQTFSLSWRGGCQVRAPEGAPPSLVVMAAMKVPGVPVDWARIRATPALEPPPRPASGGRRAHTMTLGPAALGAMDAALPFKPSGAPARPPSTDATPWFGLRMRIPARLSSAPLSGASVQPAARDPEPVRPAFDMEETFVPDAQAPALPLPELPPEPPMVLAPPLALPPPEPPVMPVIPAPPPEQKPPVVVSAPPSTLPDPWARPPAPPLEPSPLPRPPPRTFDRPAAAAVKGRFYSKFARK